MISVNNIYKKFGSLEVLQDFNLNFEAGISYAMMGPNGSGKTTLIKTILGMVIPDSGDIEVQGKSIKGEFAYRANIGYMPQIGRYPGNIKIGQLFRMMQDMRPGIENYDMELVQNFGLDKMMDKPMHTLSGGTRQKVSACLAFMFHPVIYILDEPTAGLDPMAVEVLKNKIKKERDQGKLFLITSHILSELEELTTHAIYLYEGKIFFNDSIEELKETTGETKFSTAIARLMEWSLKKQPQKKTNHV
ncbi:ABC transporter ATP-binding protein [Rhodonellum sp.]|uniref:ABC transporter ATP-binding protein n=1 Tax=Rhodonellum sp. TaxID=2231180 RepID=UPI00271CC004|nr:ABC transporter ATP-binding protein [Rhodonellum sp.]MDO9554468.1 ABC transporter ATP-binding protein [Rhodonellum sp.]